MSLTFQERNAPTVPWGIAGQNRNIPSVMGAPKYGMGDVFRNNNGTNSHSVKDIYVYHVMPKANTLNFNPDHPYATRFTFTFEQASETLRQDEFVFLCRKIFHVHSHSMRRKIMPSSIYLDTEHITVLADSMARQLETQNTDDSRPETILTAAISILNSIEFLGVCQSHEFEAGNYRNSGISTSKKLPGHSVDTLITKGAADAFCYWGYDKTPSKLDHIFFQLRIVYCHNEDAAGTTRLQLYDTQMKSFSYTDRYPVFDSIGVHQEIENNNRFWVAYKLFRVGRLLYVHSTENQERSSGKRKCEILVDP